MSKALIKSASLVSLMTFISRILGFVRDLIAAQLFGVNASVDAFYIAFKIPNFMRNLFAEGSFSQAFVPVLSDYRQNKSHAEVLAFITRMAGALIVVLSIVTLVGVLGAPYLVSLFAPGLDPYRFALASEMLRITFPYLMLISLSAFVGSVLNSYGKFAIPALTPALLNICLIATAFSLTYYVSVPVESQAWGIFIAGFVQLLFQLPSLYRSGFLHFPKFRKPNAGVSRVFKLIIPALFGSSFAQISILLNTILASFLTTGSITWLYYSERLAYFPLGVFGVALVTVVLPQLSRQHAKGSKEGFSSVLDWGLRCNLLIGIPAAITMLTLSGPLIVCLFDYGKFTMHDVLMTQKSVIAYGIGLPAFMLVKMLSSAFYARQDVLTPMKISIISLVIGMIFSILLVAPLGHTGLALATGLSAWINVLLVWTVLYKSGIYKLQAGGLKFAGQLCLANSMLVLFLCWGCGNLLTWSQWNAGQRFLHLLVLGASAIAVYIACLWLCQMRPAQFKAQVGV
ncbi:MAG: murein biosynthesis integral membrane protein MurJ [Legionellales bacterium]